MGRDPEQQPALAPTAAAEGSSSKTAETHSAGVTGSLATGGGGLPMIRSSYTSSDSDDGLPMIRSSYFPDSDDDDFCSDDFELLGREAVTDEDEEQQHISDYLAGFLSDGEYVVDTGVPIDGDEAEDGVVEDYTGMGVLTVRDHIAEGYKEYTGILTVCNDDAATYNDNDDEVFVGNEEPEYYSVVGEAECYGSSTAEALNGGEDDGYYCQDGGGVWYDQGDDGDRYAQDDDSYDAFY